MENLSITDFIYIVGLTFKVFSNCKVSEFFFPDALFLLFKCKNSKTTKSEKKAYLGRRLVDAFQESLLAKMLTYLCSSTSGVKMLSLELLKII